MSTYIAITTKDRTWHLALTMWCLVHNGVPTGTRIAISSGGEDLSSDTLWKHKLLDRLKSKGYIHDVYWGKLDVIDNHLFMVKKFLDSGCDLYIHMDDDIIVDRGVLSELVFDYQSLCKEGGVLHLFRNSWARGKPINFTFDRITSIGWAAFCTSRTTMQKVDWQTIYDPALGNHEKCAPLWFSELEKHNLPNLGRWNPPYRCQHTGNMHSTLYGYQPSWESAWSRDAKGNIVQFASLSIPQLRLILQRNQLQDYVRFLDRSTGNILGL